MWYISTLITVHAFCWHGMSKVIYNTFYTVITIFQSKGVLIRSAFCSKKWSGSETLDLGGCYWVITCSNSVLGVFDIIWTYRTWAPPPHLLFFFKSSWCLFTDQESPDSVRSGWKTSLRTKWWWCRLLNFRKKNIRIAHLEEKSCDILLSDVIFACWSQLSNYDLIIMCINLLQVFELKVNICI